MTVSTGLSLDEHGRLVILGTDDLPLEPSLERRVRRDGNQQLREWLIVQRDKINEGFESIENIHMDTPGVDSRAQFVREPFRLEEPLAPAPPRLGFWDKIFAGRRQAKLGRYERDQGDFEKEHAAWVSLREHHAKMQEAERVRLEVSMLHDVETMEDEFERALNQLQWPRETLVGFAVESLGKQLVVDVDLPEIEDIPTKQAEVAAKGLKLNIRERTASQLRKAYASHVHGVGFRLIGVAFAELPALEWVTCSGYSQRRDPQTGAERTDYLFSVKVAKTDWSRIDFNHLETVDVSECLQQFELVQKLSTTAVFTPIEPIERLQQKPLENRHETSS